MTAGRKWTFDLFPNNAPVPSVTREVLDRQQVDEPKIDRRHTRSQAALGLRRYGCLL